jgi:hypothetical protein
MYNAITQRICDGIWESNPDFKYGDGDKTCWDKKKSQASMEKFCGGDNINNPSRKKHCNREVIGTDLYNALAEAYCKNNPDKEFCGCFNVMQPGLCEQAPNLPGCKTVQPTWDKITESFDEGDIAQFEGMQPCYGSVCAGNVYQPTDWGKNCSRDIRICKADFDLGGDLIDSNINLKQDCGNTNEGGGGGGTTTSTNTDYGRRKEFNSKSYLNSRKIRIKNLLKSNQQRFSVRFLRYRRVLCVWPHLFYLLKEKK